jgi:cysteinyl-tRNA synthetase
MNFTDVDDKTIKRSREEYPDLDPKDALQKLTTKYAAAFLEDMKAIGNDVDSIKFVKATENTPAMQELISQLHKDGFAYIADDGVYFSIEKYRASGKKYGQLLEISDSNTSEERIQNDEYDKESIHDFALWKKQKGDEPAWEFTLDGHDLTGRPGWHIECSAMSAHELGQPFDIHTGGVDLIFPHHENEIAQSTAGKNDDLLAKFFVHNEHLLVEGKKMSKSLDNFFTLDDINKKGYDPLAFRLMVLQSHYRSQSNFTWENLEAAQNRLKDMKALADLRFQISPKDRDPYHAFDKSAAVLLKDAADDLNIPILLAEISTETSLLKDGIYANEEKSFIKYLETIDMLFGLQLLSSKDITDEQKETIHQREQARKDKDWVTSDQLRDELEKQGIGVRDTDHGPIWYRL